MNIIKDTSGNVLIENAIDNYVIGKEDGSMIGVNDFREGVAAVLGNDYLDCETAETEWHYRLAVAKKVGLMYVTFLDDPSVIVYDERIGKIAYSYTDTNPDYKIPENPKLIRIECDETFLFTLAKIGYIKLWEKRNPDYQNYLEVHNVDSEIEKILIPFKDKKVNIPLHERI